MRRPRILIVDDDACIRKAARLVLEDGGYEVREHADTESLWNELRCDGADVVMIDFDLARCAGQALARVITVNEELDDCSIVAMAFDVAAAELEYCDLAIMKPYVKLDLPGVVRAWVAVGKEREEDVRSPARRARDASRCS